jgi:TonB-linked SusC/RagA family outer membrane protein
MKHFYLCQLRQTTGVLICINIFLCFCMFVNAQDYASNFPPPESISSQQKNFSGRFLKDLLKEIGEAHSVSFSYESSLVEGVMVDGSLVATGPVDAQLSSLLTPLDLVYENTKNYYFIYRAADRKTPQNVSRVAKLPKLRAALTNDVLTDIHINPLQRALEYPLSVAGTVTDENNELLPGVNVVEKGTTNGTTTDAAGRYALNVEDETAVLVFSFIGYESQEVPVNSRSILNVSLVPAVQSLEEIVVIGYGTTQKKDLTGSVASVKGEAFENVPVPRLDQALQGRISGVQVTQVNGSPGAPSMIRIRGGNSILGNNEPLYVIDGFIVGTEFNLNKINVNDIESIEILKDAAAISIYGTRGANGVVLVTTKSGSHLPAGKPIVSVNAYRGVQYLANEVELLNGPDLAVYTNEEAELRQAALPFQDLANVPDVDWISETTRGGFQAPISNLDLSVKGRNEHINYYISGNYFDQKGIVKSSAISKYIFRTNLDVKLSDKLKVGTRINIARLRSENNKVAFGFTLREGITARAVFNDDGTYTAINPVTAGVQRNPRADVDLKVDHDYSTSVMGTVYLQYEPVKGLIIKSNFGPELNSYKRNRYNPTTMPENLIIDAGGDARVDNTMSVNLLNENTLSYNKDIGEYHHIDLLGGFTWQTSQSETSMARAFGFTNDVTEFNNLGLGDPLRNETTSDWNSYQLVSWLARVNYILKDKYLLTLVGRADGSSRFAGSDNTYGFFPSGAIAWRLHEEPFIRNLNVFDHLKLRGSYGIAGSQAIGSYRTLALLDPVNAYFNSSPQAGVRNGRPSSPELRWETTEQLDIGLEAGFFQGRLNFEVDYYDKITNDLLLNVQIPRQTGFTDKLQNLGSIRNSGVELLINSVNVDKKDFRWSTTFTFAGNRSEVLDLGGVNYIDIVGPTNQGGPGGRLVVGETVPAFIGVQYLGTWKSQADIDASTQAGNDLVVGGPHFKDTNGDGIISVQDFEILGSPEPEFYGGIRNVLTYKNFQLDVFFQGTYGNEIFNSLTQTAFFSRAGTNQYAITLDRWTPENPDSDIPRAGSSVSLSEIPNNSKNIEDASHLRLKVLRVSYDIPARDSKWMKNVNVYLAGTNLLLFSNFTLFDPEVSRYGTDNTRIGFSQGEYPYARTFTLGVTANF